MIISGFPAVGKTSCVKEHKGFIDLESSSWWVNGKKCDNWYKEYANVAIDLSNQGYIVFVSTHKEVRDYLSELVYEDLYVLYPSLDLKEEWIKRLLKRYQDNPTEKNRRAYEASYNYDDMIADMMNTKAGTHLVIKDINYDIYNDILEPILCCMENKADV